MTPGGERTTSGQRPRPAGCAQASHPGFWVICPLDMTSLKPPPWARLRAPLSGWIRVSACAADALAPTARAKSATPTRRNARMRPSPDGERQGLLGHIGLTFRRQMCGTGATPHEIRPPRGSAVVQQRWQPHSRAASVRATTGLVASPHPGAMPSRDGDCRARGQLGSATAAMDELRAYAGERSEPVPLLHPWTSSSDGLTTRIHALDTRAPCGAA